MFSLIFEVAEERVI